MFCMLLRKHLTGGKILSIDQPKGERIVTFTLETTDELGDKVERKLILEAMGRGANLVLLDSEGRITECIRRVEGDIVTGKRAVMPGMFYRFPEPLGGIAPLIARELEFRAGGPLTKEEQLEQGDALWEKVEAGEYTPTMLIRDGKAVDYSFWPILQYGPATELKEYPTFAQLLDEFYAAKETGERVRQKGADLIQSVTRARDRVARKMGFQMVRCGAIVVSGAAEGIDGAAMEGALKAGGTVVGVLGNGADVVYPKCNRFLFTNTQKYVCLLTEFPPGTRPVKWNFPKRNRIISGL
jgi:predicted ribosome quality control (RQC) complex YloA/Tae2 family protein